MALTPWSRRRAAESQTAQRAQSAELTLATLREDMLDNARSVVRESMADLELALDDEGYRRIVGAAVDEFSRHGLRRAAEICQVMVVANPLIKRGIGLRCAYVWGGGVEIAARAGENESQDVNDVVQAFMDDPRNRRTFTSAQARSCLETALGTDGNVFLVLFTNRVTGVVQVRSVPFAEIEEVINNPDDASEPWLYRRMWSESVLKDGHLTLIQREALYPAVGVMAELPATLNGVDVLTDAPMLHVKVNALSGWDFGIGDAYAACPWARAYRDFLSDWALLIKALSQFAWRASAKGSKSQALREKLTRRPTTTAPTGNPNSVGATAVLPAEVTLEAIPKSGATIDSDSGRPLAALVAAALGVPVTMLLGDPGQTGARAVAETLDRPMRLEIEGRQEVWADVIHTVVTYVITESVRASSGRLRGTITVDPFIEREIVKLADGADPGVDVVFPDLDDVSMESAVKAISLADQTGKLPPLTVARLLLHALGVRDVDELIDELTDDGGGWLDPLASVGQAAADAYRAATPPPVPAVQTEPQAEPQQAA